MRLGIGFLTVATMALFACSDDKAARLAAAWGCGPIDGMAAISGERAPDWVLVGEFTETRETPAAVADIACNLAADGGPVFVGVSEYTGGDTDAETTMLANLNAMIAKGAPLIVERIGDDDHPYTVRNKSMAEKAWAQTLAARVSASGATRAVLLLAHANAIAEPIQPIGERFAGYSPMPVFLPGAVVSLEVAPSPAAGLSGPAIRIHREMTDGFHGQLALNRMTRPAVDLILPAEQAVAEVTVDEEARKQVLAIEILDAAKAQAGRLLDDEPDDDITSPDAPSLQPELDLPTFQEE